LLGNLFTRWDIVIDFIMPSFRENPTLPFRDARRLFLSMDVIGMGMMTARRGASPKVEQSIGNQNLKKIKKETVESKLIFVKWVGIC